MTPVWPSDLPPMQHDFKADYAGLQTSVKLQSGRSRNRLTNTVGAVQIECRFMLTDEQAIVFEQFYATDTQDGTIWFDGPVLTPAGVQNKLCAFLGIYTTKQYGHPTMPGARLWEYNANIIVQDFFSRLLYNGQHRHDGVIYYEGSIIF